MIIKMVNSFYKICKNLHDLMPGGKGDNLSYDDVPKDALEKGISVEEEHITGKGIKKILDELGVAESEEISDQLAQQIQSEIARDHLAESDRYYDELEKMEQKFDKENSKKK